MLSLAMCTPCLLQSFAVHICWASCTAQTAMITPTPQLVPREPRKPKMLYKHRL